MDNSKRELIEAMIELLDEDEIRSLLKMAISDKRKQLNKLQQLSETPTLFDSEDFDDLEDDTASGAVLRILREAKKPMSNSDIRRRYNELFKKGIKSSTIGNALWKGKQENLYMKVGSKKGTRYTKWRYVHKDD